MAIQIQGNPINQITGLAAPKALDNVIRYQDIATQRIYAQGLDLNLGNNVDLPQIPIPFQEYIPYLVFVYHPTANLSAARLALYTDVGAGGTNVVPATNLTALTGPGTFQYLTVAALASTLTAVGTNATLVPRLVGKANVAGTASLYLILIDLTLV